MKEYLFTAYAFNDKRNSFYESVCAENEDEAIEKLIKRFEHRQYTACEALYAIAYNAIVERLKDYSYRIDEDEERIEIDF